MVCPFRWYQIHPIHLHMLDRLLHTRAPPVQVDITRAGEEIPRAPRRTSLTLRRLKHVLLPAEGKSGMDEATRNAKDAQWRWWNSQISEID